MLPSPGSRSALLLVVALWAAHGLVAWPQNPRRNPGQKTTQQVSTRGKRTFASTCANCHGLDGRGGERAPNIAENARVQRLSDAQIEHIIENGIPGTAMPAFHSLGTTDLKAVVTYLRTLQGTRQTVKVPGD